MEAADEYESRLPFNYQQLEAETPRSWNGEFDRRFAFSRQTSFRDPPQTPVSIISNASVKPRLLSRTMSTIDIAPPPPLPASDTIWAEDEIDEKFSVWSLLSAFKSGSRQMKRLFVLIALNVAYSTAEFSIGLVSGRVGLVSDAFHLTFGCGLLTFSLFAMSVSRRRPDRAYTYGYKRLEVLSAFTNALFLLFMSFSLAVEALHAYTQDESEHKHYLIVSAVTNLLVNIIGIWFFRNYARVNRVYRRAEDMNYHSVCLHVISDSIRSAGLILASWLLALGVNNGEVLCLGLTSVTVFMLGMPLLRTTGAILLQMAPLTIPSSALSKCRRQVDSLEDVAELTESRFWEFVPGHVVGSLVLQLKKGVDDRRISGFVHDLYHELGVQDLTVHMNSV